MDLKDNWPFKKDCKRHFLFNVWKRTTRAVAYVWGIWRHPRFASPNFFAKIIHAQCMDVWREAFCCGHINFITLFQSAPEHAIFIKKIEKLYGEGTPQIPLPAEGKTPPALTPPLSRQSRLRRLTLGLFFKILNTPLGASLRQSVNANTKRTHRSVWRMLYCVTVVHNRLCTLIWTVATTKLVQV